MDSYMVRNIATGVDEPWTLKDAFGDIAAITENLRKKHSAIGNLQDQTGRTEERLRRLGLRVESAFLVLESIAEWRDDHLKRLGLIELYAKDEQMRLTDAHEKIEQLEDRVGRLFGNQMETEGGLSQRVSNNALAFDKLSKMVVDLQERQDAMERIRLSDIRGKSSV